MSEEKRPDQQSWQGESLRQWYERSTRKKVRALIGATVTMFIGMFFFYLVVPHELSAKLQTANGAYTIPVFGGLWIASFMFIWLIPMREISFRGQESMERMETRIKEAIELQIKPAVLVWKRVGEAVEAEIKNGLIKEVRSGIQELRETADTLKRAASDGEQFTKDAGPALQALKRISDRVEREMESGIFDDARIIIDHFKEVAAPKDASMPDLNRALSSIGKRSNR